MSSSKKMITHAVGAILSLGLTSAALADDMPTPDGLERCYGIARAGQNDCSIASHHCGGEAKTDGDKSEWVFTPNGLCNKIVGGSTTPPKST